MSRYNSIFYNVIFIILIMGNGCKDEEEKISVCGVEDPIENLGWIKEKIGDPNSWIEIEVYYIKYQGIDYIGAFYLPTSYGSYLIIYDCEGNKICRSDDQDFEWCEIWVNCDKKILLNP